MFLHFFFRCIVRGVHSKNDSLIWSVVAARGRQLSYMFTYCSCSEKDSKHCLVLLLLPRKVVCTAVLNRAWSFKTRESAYIASTLLIVHSYHENFKHTRGTRWWCQMKMSEENEKGNDDPAVWISRGHVDGSCQPSEAVVQRPKCFFLPSHDRSSSFLYIPKKDCISINEIYGMCDAVN